MEELDSTCNSLMPHNHITPFARMALDGHDDPETPVSKDPMKTVVAMKDAGDDSSGK
jgi:hypothetical protein